MVRLGTSSLQQKRNYLNLQPMARYVALLCGQKNAINVYMVPMLYSKQLAYEN